ncbi:MAG: hypothetical protein IPH64_12675 [Comamonadaceae bacterium]|nr:hypothetical protein [Comamonadaceae bacterium]
MLVVVSECGFLAEKLQADLGQRWQVIGADQPIGDAALGEQAVLELLVAAREALGPGHVHAADGPAFRRADREGAIGAVEQVEPMHAVVRAARHGEAGHGYLDHDVVVDEGTAQPAPDPSLLGIDDDTRVQRHRAGMRRRARSARRACHADRNAPNATPTSTATTANTPIEALAKDTASMNLFVSKGKQPSWK